MSSKSERSKPEREPDRDVDTTSYEQPQGRMPDPRAAPERRQERLPHERDESARATGNRLDQPLPPSGREVTQAQQDVESGQVDTDRRGIPDDIPSERKRRG